MESRKFYSLLSLFSLLNFFLASAVGVMLRYHFVDPIRHFPYTNWLQVHSHVMFLGWITLALFLLILTRLPEWPDRPCRMFMFILFQVSVAIMFISFPLEGYGVVSISALTLNMAICLVTAFYIYRKTYHQDHPAWKYIYLSFFFLALSALGPAALGPVSALGLKETMWYDFAIYFYLHFQYNGWFFMAILGWIMLSMSPEVEAAYRKRLRSGWKVLAVVILLTYLLSLLGENITMLFNVIGGLAALIQLAVTIWIFYPFAMAHRESRDHGLHPSGIPAKVKPANLLLVISLTALGIKLVLQMMSAFPALTEMAFGRRNVVIAYLHLTLIGYVSFFLIYAYLRNGFLDGKWTGTGFFVVLLLAGFVLTEWVLVPGLWPASWVMLSSRFLFAASLFLLAGAGGLLGQKIFALNQSR
jgi:hypothetical protein